MHYCLQYKMWWSDVRNSYILVNKTVLLALFIYIIYGDFPNIP